MKNRRVLLCLLSLVGVAGPRVAAAQDAPAYPLEFIARPNTLLAGMLEVRGDFVASVSKDRVLEPFVIAPDLNYGVTDKLQVGLLHASSLCLAGEANGCPMVYQDFTFDVLYNFVRTATQDFNLHAGVDTDLIKHVHGTESETHVAVALRAGVFGSILLGSQFAIYVDPSISVGVTERDSGNKESFSIPIRPTLQALPELAIFIDTGVGGPFEDLGDNLVVPLGVGANFALSNLLDLGVQFLFLDLVRADGDPTGAADERAVVVYAAYRLGR
jgi:hypothetical protein